MLKTPVNQYLRKELVPLTVTSGKRLEPRKTESNCAEWILLEKGHK